MFQVRAVQLHHDAVTEGIQGENVGLQVGGNTDISLPFLQIIRD